MILLHPGAVSKLPTSDGARIAITVHEVPQSKPRQTFNAIGYLPGTDPSAGTLLLSAHLDHLGIGRPVNGDSIYNGANDDAAGTTAVLELAHALGAGPARVAAFSSSATDQRNSANSAQPGSPGIPRCRYTTSSPTSSSK